MYLNWLTENTLGLYKDNPFKQLAYYSSKASSFHGTGRQKNQGNPKLNSVALQLQQKQKKNLKLIEIPKRFIAAFSLLPGKVKHI